MYILTMTAGEVITLITLAIGLVGAIIALIPSLIKLFSALKTLVKNKNWKQIIKIAKTAMETAEATGSTGADKKQMVIDAVMAGCKEANIEMDADALKDLCNYIDEMIDYYNNMTKATESSSFIETKDEK